MNKYPKYKNSGVNWLGEIPKEWEVRRLKNDSYIKNGATPSTSNENYWNGEIFWVTPAEINSIIFLYNSVRKITDEGYRSCGINLKCLSPTLNEQIVQPIENETTKIEKTITTIQKKIRLVEEYKTALIAEAVTGKIDVRVFEIPQTEMPLDMVAEEAVNYGKEN